MIEEIMMSKDTGTYEQITRFWIINVDGAILLKDIRYQSKSLNISDLTLSVFDKSQAIEKLESQYGLIVPENNIQQIYAISINENDVQQDVVGCVAKLCLDAEQEKIILERVPGNFIDYRELEDVIKYFDVSDAFKEEFYTVLSWLDSVYH
jgi:hypothetical protein